MSPLDSSTHLFYAHTPQALVGIAQSILTLSKHKLFILEGTLGVGKTSLVKTCCQQLESKDTFSSPSYSIVNEYRIKKNKRIFHLDLYRVKTLDEAIDIGIEDILYEDSYCFIEWPDIIKTILPLSHNCIQMTTQDDMSRKITLTSPLS